MRNEIGKDTDKQHGDGVVVQTRDFLRTKHKPKLQALSHGKPNYIQRTYRGYATEGLFTQTTELGSGFTPVSGSQKGGSIAEAA